MKRLLFSANGGLVLSRARRRARDTEEVTDDYAPSLQSLPLEVLHSICYHLSSIGLRRFRLVCRLFSDVGMRHLATGAYLYPTKLSLKRLVDLSQTELSKSITSLYIAAEHFDFCHTYEEWKHLKVPSFWYDEGPTEKELHQRYSICRRAFAEQEDLLNRGALTESVSVFVGRCPKLDTLSLSFADGLNIPQEAPSAIRQVIARMPTEARPHFDIGITAEILRIFQAKVLKHLQISYIPLEAVAREANQSDLAAIRTAISSLNSLALGVAHEPTAPEEENDHEYWPENELFSIEEHADTVEGQISALITAARDLRHLRFETRLDPERGLDGCLLNTVFDVQINPNLFPGLRSLSLERIKISGRTLRRFLMAHEGTLGFVRLQDMQMIDGGDEMNWWQFWVEMTGKLPQLRRFLHYGRLRDGAELDWGLGSVVDGRSSIWTHALDKYLKKGWPHGGEPPFDKDEMKTFYVPNPVIFENEETKNDWNCHNQYIEDPETDHEWEDEDEDEKRFQRMHTWD
jgi:hypothetical protein